MFKTPRLVPFIFNYFGRYHLDVLDDPSSADQQVAVERRPTSQLIVFNFVFISSSLSSLKRLFLGLVPAKCGLR